MDKKRAQTSFIIFTLIILIISVVNLISGCTETDPWRGPRWKEVWMQTIGSVVTEFPLTLSELVPSDLPEDLPALQSPMNERGDLKGQWVLVNRRNYQLAKESKYIDEEHRPKDASDIDYVGVIGPVKTLSQGYWKPIGSSGNLFAEEKFSDVYIIYIIDWTNRKLVNYDKAWGDSKSSSVPEDQAKARKTIKEWLWDWGLGGY